MDALLVFPYFLVKLFTRVGMDPQMAEWCGATLSCICLVGVMMAPFHPRPLIKTTMVGLSWIIIVLASAGCVAECRDAQRAAERREDLVATPQLEAIPEWRVVNGRRGLAAG